jgi:tRNA1Val (adenine37-N6)-methyltransferase
MKQFDAIGNLKLIQSPFGVKASVDGLLLARFVEPQPGWRVADLGCGNGFIGLLTAAAQPRCRVVGVEMQAILVGQGMGSARLNHLSNIRFVRADLRRPPWMKDLAGFDLVLANPPYRKAGSGRLSPDHVRAAARHELHGDIWDFARAAAALLREGRSAAWVFPADREGDLLGAVTGAGMEPVRRRHVISREGKPPVLVLLETTRGKNPGKVFEEEPLILYEEGKGRDYTEEARTILYGNLQD